MFFLGWIDGFGLIFLKVGVYLFFFSILKKKMVIPQGCLFTEGLKSLFPFKQSLFPSPGQDPIPDKR